MKKKNWHINRLPSIQSLPLEAKTLYLAEIRRNIVTIGRPGLYQSETNPDINRVLGTNLKETLPYFLNHIVSDKKTVPALVTAGSPLLLDAVVAIAKETDVAPNAAKLKAWATSVDPKAPCDTFAAAAVPINSVIGDIANAREGKATTHQQDYFLQPAYGPISHRDDIVIHYKSKLPAFFWGTTPNRSKRLCPEQ